MITEKLQNAINDQIIAEMWSANLYLSMSFYLEKEGYDGMAHWMKKQSQEELEHAYDMASFLQKRGGTAKVSMIRYGQGQHDRRSASGLGQRGGSLQACL